MPSLSFDPAADFYDATRGYPDDVALQIAQAVDAAAGVTAHTAYLEVGVGTGRIALPVASLGRIYTGVDISRKMLAQLETKALATGWQEQSLSKYPWGSLSDEQRTSSHDVLRLVKAEPPSALRLVVSDIQQLPFFDHTFDAVIAVHIFHLVGDWEQALQEIVRVLRPGGRLLQCWDSYDRAAPIEVINATWRELVRELGGDVERPGASSQVVQQWFQQRGWQTQSQLALSWLQRIVPREAINHIARRYWSSSWRIPDAIFAASIQRLEQWAQEYFGSDIDRLQSQERHFFIQTTQL